jgi:succinate dehydrogenase / fumarate reductase, cytochrome b subunit
MVSLRTTLRGYASYQGGEGQIAFLLHRVTGLGTLLFLAVHILHTATVYFKPNLYTAGITLFRTTFFGLAEIVLIFCVFYHGFNGLRIAIFDMLYPKGWKLPFTRSSVKANLILTFIFWLPATFIILRNLLIHNYGLFGG